MAVLVTTAAAADAPEQWRIGRPIVTYWAGPPMTETTAEQMAAGGWNLVWCRENELPVAERHGLRAYLHDPLLRPASLDDPAKRAELEAFIDRVKGNKALYAYHLKDEPNASVFPDYGRLVAYLRRRDPAHLAYLNLYPIYASNKQLGTPGEPVPAYREYLRRFLETVKPDLLSYDHYHFGAKGDGSQYFRNLALIREAAFHAGIPFLNIVQACSWTPRMRIPTGDELRWLVYTSLAYGAQGISYYVYSHPRHHGAMALADGTPTSLYYVASVLNREFEAVATQLQSLRSLAVYHAGMTPPGTHPLPAGAAFRLTPPVPAKEYTPPAPVEGFVLGCFGKPGSPAATASHVLVVNLNYRLAAKTTLTGPGPLELFDPASGSWSPVGASEAVLLMLPGGGKLVRVKTP